MQDTGLLKTCWLYSQKKKEKAQPSLSSGSCITVTLYPPLASHTDTEDKLQLMFGTHQAYSNCFTAHNKGATELQEV